MDTPYPPITCCKNLVRKLINSIYIGGPLWWLPQTQVIPPNLRLVVSSRTIPQTMETQGIQCVRLGGLTEEEGRELVAEYLEEFHKKLTVKQLELLIRFAVSYIFFYSLIAICFPFLGFSSSEKIQR